MRGFASIATGYSGLELSVGYPEAGVSTGLLPFGLGDTTMSVQAVIGTLAALEHRERTGQRPVRGREPDRLLGRRVGRTADRLPAQRPGLRGAQGNASAAMCPHGLYPAEGEDRWVALAVRDAAEWRALCGVIGRPDWAGGRLAGHGGRPAGAHRRDRRGHRCVELTARSGRSGRGAARGRRAGRPGAGARRARRAPALDGTGVPGPPRRRRVRRVRHLRHAVAV